MSDWVDQLQRAESEADHTHREAALAIRDYLPDGRSVSPRTVESWARGGALQPSQGYRDALARYIYEYTGEEAKWNE